MRCTPKRRMGTEGAPSRVYGQQREISYARTRAFFDERVKRPDGNALTATMYQDPDLAARRDRAEKDNVLPLLEVLGTDRVLDVGCGAGRWAELLAPMTAAYLGIDFSPGLLRLARRRVPARTAIFQNMSAAALDPARLRVPPPFSLVICSGVLAYLNDADAGSLLATIGRMAIPVTRIYLREPVAKAERLTLDSFWSDELNAAYSAIYRTRREYMNLLAVHLPDSRFRVRAEAAPFGPELQNRDETEQWFILLQGAGSRP